MNIRSIASAAIVTAMTLALAAPATVLAGDRHGGGHQGGGHQGGGHRGGHRGGHYKKHRYNRHNYGHRGYSNNYYYKDNDNDDLLIGLVVGGILGYAVNNTQRQNDISYERYPATRQSYSATGSCLQEREYQTTVIVGGREVDAYGTACLQPDGSWKRSPAELASY